MSKIAVVYWSGTGNTEVMANKIAEGVKMNGKEVDVFTPNEFNAEMVENYDVLALGCSSMGDEVLEEIEFQPMYDSIRGSLNGKKIALFGSYGWGDGLWMREWDEDAKEAGATLVNESLILNETPDADGENECIEFGKSL